MAIKVTTLIWGVIFLFLFSCQASDSGSDGSDSMPTLSFAGSVGESSASSAPSAPAEPFASNSTSCQVPLNNPYFIHLSDIHLNYLDSCYRNSDLGDAFWDRTKDRLELIIGCKTPPRFILFTGDLPGHCGNSGTPLEGHQKKIQEGSIQEVLKNLRELVAGKGIPLLFVPGNNDALNGDYFPFSDANNQSVFSLARDPNLPYPALNAHLPCGQPPCMLESDTLMGYYAAKPIDGLRVLALNTVMFVNGYHAASTQEWHAAGDQQMDWIGAQLDSAAKYGDKVYIMMHVPPGLNAYSCDSLGNNCSSFWNDGPSADTTWQYQFLAHVGDHYQDIAGVFYGHTHMDELRLLYKPKDPSNPNAPDEVSEIALGAPGVTTDHGNNPGFKVVWYDGKSKEPVDFITHYARHSVTPSKVINYGRWGNQYYQFREVFECCSSSSVYEGLVNQDLDAVNSAMDSVYYVLHQQRHPDPHLSAKTLSGMVVKSELGQ